MKLDELEKAALAATPGPWRWGYWKHRSDLSENYGHGDCFPFYEFSPVDNTADERVFSSEQYGTIAKYEDQKNIIKAVSCGYGGETDLCVSKIDAKFISLANPATILALLEDRKALIEAIEKHCWCEDLAIHGSSGPCGACKAVTASKKRWEEVGE